MKNDIVIAAEPRDTRGKNEARRLRARGMAPAIVYGAGSDPVAVAVSPKEVNKILHSSTGSNTIFNLTLDAQQWPVKIVDWQYDPIKTRLLHLDLQRIDMSKRMTVRIPVITTGDARGVKEQGGAFEVITREVEIECLPGDIPDNFTVDVSGMMLNQSLRASELQLSGSMKLITPADTVLSHVITTRGTDTTDEAAAGTAAEPEVIKKGKKEEEAEEKGGKKK